MKVKLDVVGDRVVQQLVCPRCDSHLFELVSLGIPGTGASVCLRCRAPVSAWSHDRPISE